MRMKHGSSQGLAASAKPRLLAAFTAVAMMFATAVPALMPKPAMADDPEVEGAICTPQDITMGDNTSDAKKDDGIATWVGRDMYVGSPEGKTSFGQGQAPDKSYAVEAEGLTLVGGKLAINSTKASWNQRGFRFGIVGFGAQYRPAAGSDTLVVAGGSNSNITLTDSENQSTNVLGWGQLGRGWIGTTNSDESEYNAKIAGRESTVMAPVESTTIYLKNSAAEPPLIHAWYDPNGPDITVWNNRPRMYRVTSEWVAYTFPTTAKIGFKFDNGPTKFFTNGTDLAWTVDNGNNSVGTPSVVKSLYSTSSSSVVSWNQPNPLTQVRLNGETYDYHDNTTAIRQLSDTLGAIPQSETSSVQVNQTAENALNYGYTRQKYNSGQFHPAEGSSGAYTSPYIGVRMTFDANNKEKMIIFDGGQNNQNSTIVFNVNASDLNSKDANGLVFKFQNIKPGASVVVNVKGDQEVEFHNGWRFWWNGTEIGNGYYRGASEAEKKGYDQASQAILWNFQNTPKLTIRGGVLKNGQALRWANTGGSSTDVAAVVDDDPAAAMIGSILVPRGSFEDHVTTNGRVWVGLDFMMYNPTKAVDFPAGIGEGASSSVIDMDQERHNFPWKGSLRSECSAIAWNKTDESGNLLGGSTWGVYKSVQDAIKEENALYPAVKDNDIPSGDWNPKDGEFRVGSLQPNARYYIKEMTAPEGYVKSDLIYVIKTTEKGSVSNKDIIAVYNTDGTANTDSNSWKLTDVVGGESGTKGIANTRKGGSVQWGKYADGDNSHKGLAGSEWTLTKTGEGGWSQLITDNTKAVESVSLYKDNQAVGESMTVTEGETFNLTAKVMPEDATQDVNWSSSDPDAVEVQDGHITVRHTPTNGQTVVITATTVDTNASGDRIEAHVTLTIQETALQELTLQYNGQTAPSEISATVGNKLTLTATATPATLNNSITWESTDTSVATVDRGVVTPLKAGETTIWAKCKSDRSKWKSVVIKVNEAVDPNATVIYFNPKSTVSYSGTPYIYYGVDGSSWISEPVQMTPYCGDWYAYTISLDKKKVSFYFTKSTDKNSRLYTATNNTNFAVGPNVSSAVVVNYETITTGGKPTCPTSRAAAAPQATAVQNTTVSVEEADAAASLQVFRRARLQARGTTAEQPTYKDSNSAVGQFTILNLPAGTYTLKETTAPDGYYLNPTEYTFTIDDTGKVTWTGGRTPSLVGDMGWIADVPTEFSWDKIDAGYEGNESENGPLVGTKWRLEKFKAAATEGGDGVYETNIAEIEDCNTELATDCVGNDQDPTGGSFTLKKLTAGKYRLVETYAPTGYEVPENVYYYFELGAQAPDTAVTWNKGTLDTWDKQTGSFTGTSEKSVNGNVVPNYRETGSVNWSKVNSENANQFLRGSEWKVRFKAEGAENFSEWYQVLDCATTPAQCAVPGKPDNQPTWTYDHHPSAGVFQMQNLQWGDYELVETKAPDGFYPSDKTYTFTVSKDNVEKNIAIQGAENGNKIPNTPGFELPSTGGEGNTLIVLVGFALTAISMLGYAIATRKRV